MNPKPNLLDKIDKLKPNPVIKHPINFTPIYLSPNIQINDPTNEFFKPLLSLIPVFQILVLLLIIWKFLYSESIWFYNYFFNKDTFTYEEKNYLDELNQFDQNLSKSFFFCDNGNLKYIWNKEIRSVRENGVPVFLGDKCKIFEN